MTSKESFLLADRKVGKWIGSFSISATWIWAPALLISSQLAYTHGIWGVLWFIVPNITALILFSIFAAKIRKRHPNGFTLSGYMREIHSERVQVLYLIQLIGLALCSFAVQLLAGGVLLASLTGLQFQDITVLMAGVALLYTVFGGLKADVRTDTLQMGIILAVVLLLVPWVIHEAGGWQMVKEGQDGYKGGVDPWTTFVTIGVSYLVGLTAGPFGDQSFWQRAFAIKKGEVKQAFIMGAGWFAIVPILLSLIGFSMAGNFFPMDDPQLTSLYAVRYYLPEWAVIPFILMILCGLMSTLASNLSAIASLAGHDLFSRFRMKDGLLVSRGAMVLLCIGGIMIANIPGMQILYLSLFYGTVRATTLLPTILSLTYPHVSERGVFYGILGSFCLGLPLFILGHSMIGSLTTVLLSGFITILYTRGETKWAESHPRN